MKIRLALVLCTAVLALGLVAPTFADDDSAAYIRELGSTRAPSGDIDDDRVPPTTSGGYGDDNVVVPEPATLGLLGLGLAAVGIARRRRG